MLIKYQIDQKCRKDSSNYLFYKIFCVKLLIFLNGTLIIRNKTICEFIMGV